MWGQTPTDSPASSGQQETGKTQTKKSSEEIVSSDTSTTFRLRVNLVLVRAVVRGANGKAIANLKKEDFQVADNGKPQVITAFSMETAIPETAGPRMEVSANANPEGTAVVNSPGYAKPAGTAQRFVAVFFDDLQLSTEDAMYSQNAARKVLASVTEGDRVGIFTTSGQVDQDFTADQKKLDEAIRRVRPVLSDSTLECMPPSVYVANRIVEYNDTSVLAAAMRACGTESTTRAAAERFVSFAENKIRRATAAFEVVVERMKKLPGQRTMVVVSPGFIIPSGVQFGNIVDRAIRAKIVINAIDARGLYTPTYADAASSPAVSRLAYDDPELMKYIRVGERVQDEVLAELADGTGGVFLHDRNDIEEGLRREIEAPEVSYVLGFTPRDLKLDGKYHKIKVTLAGKQDYGVQARHGYYAPRAEVNPEETAKQEIEEAAFSREEVQDFPVECQTQFFSTADGVHLTVVARIDTNTLKFRKEQERDADTVTVLTAVFDGDGNLIDGRKRVIEMDVTKATRERLNKEGLKVKSSFTLPAGSYVVRVVARDSEGAQMTAVSRAVVIQ